MTINNFEDLEIWQEARDLCKYIFELTSKEPFNKDFRFRDQIRAASGSIMDNIAEGFDRDGRKEFIQFLSIAKGSCAETKSQSYRAIDFSYISQDDFEILQGKTNQLSKKIRNFMNYLIKSDIKGSKYH